MSRVQLTSITHMRPVAAFLAERGEPVERLLEKALLPPGCLENPKALVPTAALWRFRSLAAARTGSPNLTLHAIEPWELAELGDLGRALLGRPTLRRTIQSVQRLALAESQTAVLELRPWHGGCEFFSNRFLLRQDEGEWQAELYLFMWMLKIVRLVDPTWSPEEIWCSASATKERVQAIESFGARPLFRQCCTGFPIPSVMLAMAPRRRGSSQRDPKVDERVLWSQAPLDSIAGAIGQMIRTYAGDRWLTLSEASEALSMSPRTLQRQLSEDGKAYSEILEEIRAESAKELLEHTDARFSEIAEQLGYSNLSNFNRAFHRWSGVLPREYRAGLPGATSQRH
jgi:AraC-like DNA-binding protein